MNVGFLLRRIPKHVRFSNFINFRCFTTKREVETNKVKYIEINQIETFSQLNKESKIDKSLLCFYLFINCPIYVISFQLGLGLTQHNILIDLARFYIKILPFLHFITSGINFSTTLKNFEKKLNEDIQNNIIVDQNTAKNQIKKFEKILFSFTLPSFLSFLTSQYLLSTSLLTNKTILISFSVFGLVGLINLLIIFKIFGRKSHYMKLNLVFFIINILSIVIVYNFVKKHKNLDKVDDLNRLDLPNLSSMIIQDNLQMEEDINELYKDISSDNIKKIQTIFENEDFNPKKI